MPPKKGGHFKFTERLVFQALLFRMIGASYAVKKTATVPGTCRSRSAGHLGVVCKGLRGGQLDRWIAGSAAAGSGRSKIQTYIWVNYSRTTGGT